MRVQARPFAKFGSLLAAGLLSTGAALDESVPVARISCTDLATATWGGFRIDSSELREASDANPTHCFVAGTIDAEIHFELLLPLTDVWNGRFVMGGGGGFVGSVENQALELSGLKTPLELGFATVGTDTGHQANTLDASWALDRDDRVLNFGYRAVHLTTEVAKTIIRLHYGRDIDYSYFIGCSRGGGQAMMESQRYPDDFDGIVAGAPAYDWPGLGAHFIQAQKVLYPDPNDLSAAVVTPAVRELLAAAILDACDDVDGVSDGILNDPRACDFRPEALARCSAGSGNAACVTSAQLAAIQVVYGGASLGGEQIFPGFPFGGEDHPEGWGAWITGAADAFGPQTPSLHYAFGTQMYKYLVFDDPDWDYSSYDFSDWTSDTRAAAAVLNATDTDLTPFKVAGGKLILWTGWSDPAITALGTVQYYEGVRSEDSEADQYARLFMMPGVLHCGGGPGPDQVEWLDLIQRWVESGEAPERAVATKRNAAGETEMQRPLCAYPMVAQYDGTGDARREDSFTCTLPAWRSLFNGEDLSGWTVKLRGNDTGDDPYGTFRVEDGLLTVGYEGYDTFDDRFGHLFYEAPFSQYQLRIEYRFIGEQAPGGPDWAFKNSGVMIHAQSPESMLRDQDFPISIEAQFLGGDGTEARPTANLCTPGTHVEIDGVLTETHCISSTSPTFPGEEWVTVDIWVRGNSSIVHVVEGDTVLTYGRPVVGGGVVDGFAEGTKVDGTPLRSGYIALQSESHPIQFRRVLIRELGPGSL